VIGAVLCLFVLFVAGPIGLFLTGAIWSAVFGWAQSDNAEPQQAAEAANATSG
jgi:hypothetical protein